MALPSPPVFDECVSSAAQARKMGLRVGDTIQGLHKCGKYESCKWHKLRITLTRIDRYYTDWIASEREDGLTWDNRQSSWSDPYKTKNCGLAYRTWERVNTPPEHIALMDDMDDIAWSPILALVSLAFLISSIASDAKKP
jgi:hypothetical protein